MANNTKVGVKRPSLELLEEAEIDDCLMAAYENLSDEERLALRNLADDMCIRRFGLLSLLRLLIVVHPLVTPRLARLDHEVLEAEAA